MWGFRCEALTVSDRSMMTAIVLDFFPLCMTVRYTLQPVHLELCLYSILQSIPFNWQTNDTSVWQWKLFSINWNIFELSLPVSRTYRNLLRRGTWHAGHPSSQNCSVVSLLRDRSGEKRVRTEGRKHVVSRRTRPLPACTRYPAPLSAVGELASRFFVPLEPPCWDWGAAVLFDFQLWTQSRVVITWLTCGLSFSCR